MARKIKETEIILCGKPIMVKNDLESWCTRNGREDLLKEWDREKNGCSPATKSYGSQYKVFWKCSVCGFGWTANINSRTSGSGCPNCAGNVFVQGKNDLETWCKENNLEELLEEWDYEKNIFKPNEISRKNIYKASWKCIKCGEHYESRVYDRVTGHRCPVCTGFRVKAGFNDFETWCLKNGKENFLTEWSEENTISPSQVSYGSGKRVLWVCSVCGHKWLSEVKSRKQGTGCPSCGDRQRVLSRRLHRMKLKEQ